MFFLADVVGVLLWAFSTTSVILLEIISYKAYKRLPNYFWIME